MTAGVFAHSHESEAEHRLALAQGGDGPAADRVADGDLADVADADGHAFMGGDDDTGEGLQRGHPADALDEARLAGGRDIAAADIRVVLAQGPAHVVEREPVLGELPRLDHDFKLFGEPAPRIDLRDPRDPPQSRPDHPILERAELGQVVDVAGDQVVINLAQAGGDRTHHRLLDPLREPGLAQPFADLLPGEIDVGVVAKDRDHLRQPEFGDGADLLEPLEPPQGLLDGEGNLPLDLFGGQLRGHGVDLDLDRGRVRERIQRELDRGPDAEGDEDARHEQNDEAVFQAEPDQGVEHGKALRAGAGSIVNATGAQGVFHGLGLEQERAGRNDCLS